MSTMGKTICMSVADSIYIFLSFFLLLKRQLHKTIIMKLLLGLKHIKIYESNNKKEREEMELYWNIISVFYWH